MTAMALALSRRLAEEPPSRLAVWARRIAVFALAVAALAIIFARGDLLEIMPVLVTFGVALVLAAVAIVLAFASFVALWINGGPGFFQAVTAVFIGIVMLGYPGYLAYKGWKLPRINDITTDASDPPRFDVVARLRRPSTNAYPGPATFELQNKAWPDIEPLFVTVSPRAAFDGAIKVITKRKWRIVDARVPLFNREGHIEAIARTPIMGFRDDVVVRIRPTREGARVDVRSASRYGVADFGANADRVLGLLDAIDDAAIPETPAKPAPAKPAPPAAAKSSQSGKR